MTFSAVAAAQQLWPLEVTATTDMADGRRRIDYRVSIDGGALADMPLTFATNRSWAAVTPANTVLLRRRFETTFSVTLAANRPGGDLVVSAKSPLWLQKAGFYVPPANAVLTLPAPTLQTGRNLIVASIDAPEGFDKLLVEKRVPLGTWTTVAQTNGDSVLIDATGTTEVRFSTAPEGTPGRIASPVVTATPVATGPTLTWLTAPPTMVTGVASVTVIASSGTFDDLTVYANGVSTGGNRRSQAEDSTAGRLDASFDSRSLANGAREIRAVASVDGVLAATPVASILVDNALTQVTVDDLSDLGDGEFPQVFGSTRNGAPWVARVRDLAGNLCREWPQARGKVRFCWDGLHGDGNLAADGAYNMEVEVRPAGGTPTVESRIVNVIRGGPDALFLIQKLSKSSIDYGYARYVAQQAQQGAYNNGYKMAVFVSSKDGGGGGVNQQGLYVAPGIVNKGFRTKLRYRIANTVKTFCLYDHGYRVEATQYPRASWGGLIFSAGPIPANQRYQAYPFENQYLDIRAILNGRRLQFGWIDTCFGAGGAPPSVPLVFSSQTANPSYDGSIRDFPLGERAEWAYAFGSSGGGGVTLLFNGWAIQNQRTSPDGTESEGYWLRWRRRFMNAFFARNFYFSDALYDANSNANTPQPYAATRNPWSQYNIGGRVVTKTRPFGYALTRFWE